MRKNINYQLPHKAEVGRKEKADKEPEEHKRESRKEKVFFFYNFSFYNLKYPEFVWSYGAPAPSFGIEFNLRVETARIIHSYNNSYSYSYNNSVPV